MANDRGQYGSTAAAAPTENAFKPEMSKKKALVGIGLTALLLFGIWKLGTGQRREDAPAREMDARLRARNSVH